MAAKVLVINPSGEEKVGVLQEVFDEEGVSVDEVVTQEAADLLVSGPPSSSVRVVPSLPKSSTGYDCMVILGSPLGVLTEQPAEGPPDEDQTPDKTKSQIEMLIRSFHNVEKPVLGLCLGSQLVVRAFGGKVHKLPKEEKFAAMPVQFADQEQPKGTEFGWHPQEFTDAAKEDPIVGPALQTSGADKFMQWHSDTFEFPEGAVPLSTRPTCPNQAFRMGRNTYAFQYHIEVGRELSDAWYQDYITGADSYEDKEDWKSLSEKDSQAMKDEHAERLADGTIDRAENFTKSVMRGLLKEAEAVRTREIASLEMKLSSKRNVRFYVGSATKFLKGEGGFRCVKTLTVSALGPAINTAVAVVARLEAEGTGRITRIRTQRAELNGRGCEGILVDLERA